MISYSGDQNLGGNDFDQAVIDWIMTQIRQRPLDVNVEGQNVSLSMDELHRDPFLRDLAEDVKIKVVEEGGHASFSVAGYDLRLDQKTFLEWTSPLTASFLPPILKAGEEALIDFMNT